MSQVEYITRPFEAEPDYPMIEEWARGHARPAPPLAILPKLGLICEEVTADGAEPVAALFLYMDNSVGVCFAEHAITKPGLSMKRAKAALLRTMDCMKRLAALHGYGFMKIFTLPAIARVLKSNGFHPDGAAKVPMFSLTKEASHGN